MYIRVEEMRVVEQSTCDLVLEISEEALAKTSSRLVHVCSHRRVLY
jgi:hypothetical protein